MSDQNETRQFSINVTVNAANYKDILKAMDNPPPYRQRSIGPDDGVPGTVPTSTSPPARASEVSETEEWVKNSLIVKQTTIELPYIPHGAHLTGTGGPSLKQLHDAYLSANLLMFLWSGSLNDALINSPLPALHKTT